MIGSLMIYLANSEIKGPKFRGPAQQSKKAAKAENTDKKRETEDPEIEDPETT
jgi:hypothetical protein